VLFGSRLLKSGNCWRLTAMVSEVRWFAGSAYGFGLVNALAVVGFIYIPSHRLGLQWHMPLIA
jgi:hypothetical protein